MHQVRHSVPVVHPGVVVIGLQGLTGAVGFLCGHPAVLTVQRGARVAALLPAAAPGQRAVPPVLDVHGSQPGTGLPGEPLFCLGSLTVT